jgi:hypothetical protein
MSAIKRCAATLSIGVSVCRLPFINITLGGMDEIDCLSSRGHKCSASTILKPEMSSLTDL